MITAHAPAGYLTSKLLFPHFAAHGTAYKPFVLAGMFGAIAPDLDLLYFYLVDQRQHHHHTLWPHFPILWAGLLLVSVLWSRAERNKAHAPIAVIFALNGLLHMVLDTLVGRVWWLAPFVDKSVALFAIPARYSPWWLSFIFHWTFLFELAIVAGAIYLWRPAPAARAVPPGRKSE